MAAIATTGTTKPNFSQIGLLLPSFPTKIFTSKSHLSLSSANNCSGSNTSRNNSTRRQNSYATSSINSKDIDLDNMMASGRSRNSQFLDPSLALACRRRLPPTPANVSFIANEYENDASGSSYIGTRRGSSPRILPTPPPNLPPSTSLHLYGNTSVSDSKLPPSSTQFQNLNDNVDGFKYCGGLERRPSSGRRLPAEPPHQAASETNSLLNGGNNFSDSNLKTSVSIKNPHQFLNIYAQLPPVPVPISDNSLDNGSNRLTRTSIVSTKISKNSPNILTTQRDNDQHTDNVNTVKRTSSRTPAETQCTDFLTTSSFSSNQSTKSKAFFLNSATDTTLQITQSDSILQTASAPSSPKNSTSSKINNVNATKCFENSATFNINIQSTSETTSQKTPSNTVETSLPETTINTNTKNTRSESVSSNKNYILIRKFSDTFEPSLSLARNGSMAFLLEQQHMFRREFCAMNDSVPIVASTTSASGTTRSNSSSLSLSIEQLNCATSSKPGSDVEESSPCIDARMHGINPSLYIAGKAARISNSGSTSSFMVTEATVNTQSIATASTSSSNTPSSLQCLPLDAVASANANTASTLTSGDTTAFAQHQPRPSGLGLIHCTLQHFPVRKRLRVSVLKIEGLAGELKRELELQPFCKVNLLPGSKHKQMSVVKRGRDAVFNQEFFFDGIATDELNSKNLSIEVCHQSTTKLQKDSEIGEIFVPLKDLTQLTLKKEVRIIEELKYSVSNKKFGKIYLTSCIENEARRLTINLIKVDDLPKWGIIGAPDVCVRITLSQGLSVPQTKSSRVLKSTTSAVYKEAVMFLISTKKSDLQHTRITISVHDLSRTVTGDDLIGSVYLGELALDKSEVEQWRHTIEHIGKEYKGCHNLKLNRQNAPDVRISETQSDPEDAE